MRWWNHSIHAGCSNPILHWSNSYRGAGRLPAVTSSGSPLQRAATSAVRQRSYRPEGKAGPRSRHYICWRSVGGQSRPNLARGAAPPWYLCLIFGFTVKKRPAPSWRTEMFATLKTIWEKVMVKESDFCPVDLPRHPVQDSLVIWNGATDTWSLLIWKSLKWAPFHISVRE